MNDLKRSVTYTSIYVDCNNYYHEKIIFLNFIFMLQEKKT